jgi:uncharacterized damage-inducible protein DinB
MEPLRIYEYLTLARKRILDGVRSLSPEQYERPFTIGRGTLARTLTHIMASEWYYVERMGGRAVPPYEQWPIREEEAPAFPALEAAWAKQAERTRAAVAAVRDWEAPIGYRITNDEGRPEIMSPSAADIFTQLAFHEVHHRAQVMNILRQLGITAEDLDFNTLMYPRRPAPA